MRVGVRLRPWGSQSAMRVAAAALKPTIAPSSGPTLKGSRRWLHEATTASAASASTHIAYVVRRRFRERGEPIAVKGDHVDAVRRTVGSNGTVLRAPIVCVGCVCGPARLRQHTWGVKERFLEAGELQISPSSGLTGKLGVIRGKLGPATARASQRFWRPTFMSPRAFLHTRNTGLPHTRPAPSSLRWRWQLGTPFGSHASRRQRPSLGAPKPTRDHAHRA